MENGTLTDVLAPQRSVRLRFTGHKKDLCHEKTLCELIGVPPIQSMVRIT